MFRSVRQSGFLPVLQSFGSSPLEIWESKVKFGCIRRVTDEQVRALALELSSTNVSTCFVYCPKNPRASLGILMPFFVMIVKNMSRYFTFEITVLDDRNVHRRFRMSNFQKMIQVQHFSASMPLCLEPGWNEIYFDLADITQKAYKTNYMETTRIQIHANCRIRVIYFCDRIYEDKDIPQKLKMFLPTSHECRKKKEEDDEQKREPEMLDAAEFEGESELSEEEAEEMYYIESIHSIEGLKQEAEEGMSIISRIDEEEDEGLSGEDYGEDEHEKIKKDESVKDEPLSDAPTKEEPVQEGAPEAEADVKEEAEAPEKKEVEQGENEAEEG